MIKIPGALAYCYQFTASKPLFQCSISCLTIGFLIGFIRPILHVLILFPINIFHLHVWRLATCLLVETNFIAYLYTAYCTQKFMNYIIPNWKSIEIMKYLLIVHLTTVFSIILLSLMLLIFLQYWDMFYQIPIYGLLHFDSAFLIALKQFLPDTVVITTPLGRIKNWHLPVLSVCCSVILWLIGGIRGTVTLQLIIGLQTGWSYLRFIQPHPENNEVCGDDSEHFTWSSLFPKSVQPFASVIGRLAFRLLTKTGLCRKQILQMESFEALESVETHNESRDAERKRQKALRMLNDRITSNNEAPLSEPDVQSSTVIPITDTSNISFQNEQH